MPLSPQYWPRTWMDKLLVSKYSNIGFTASTFEFRSPSEHKIDGVSYDMEM